MRITPEKKEASVMRGKYREIVACTTPEKNKQAESVVHFGKPTHVLPRKIRKQEESVVNLGNPEQVQPRKRRKQVESVARNRNVKDVIPGSVFL